MSTAAARAAAARPWCSAGYLLDGMKEGRWKRLLFCGTGALLSPTSTQQGESIPAICHAVALAAPGCETV